MEEKFQIARSGIKYAELLAAAVGFVYWRKLRKGYLRAIPVYLLLLFCCELFGHYLRLNHPPNAQKHFYNYFVVPGEFLFVHYLYYQFLDRPLRKYVPIFSVLFLVAMVVEAILVRQINWQWMSLSYLTGGVSILILATLYLLQLVSDETVVRLNQNFFFWVNLGLMLFYVGTIPYYATVGFLYKIQPQLAWLMVWMFVVLNYLLYSFFIVGFICFRTQE